MRKVKIGWWLALAVWPGIALAQAFPNNPNLNYGTPQDVNVAVLATATAVGTPAKYHYIIVENEGSASICASFVTSSITAPTTTGCATGFELNSGGSLTLTASFGMLPNSQLYVIAAAAGTNTVWESAQ